MSLPPSSLRHMTSLKFHLAPLSQSSRTLRLLLSRLPHAPSSAGTPVPALSTCIVAAENEMRVAVTYSDKSVVQIVPGRLTINELIRKVEAPARALRLKEEGL